MNIIRLQLTVAIFAAAALCFWPFALETCAQDVLESPPISAENEFDAAVKSLARDWANPDTHETLGDLARKAGMADTARLFYEGAYAMHTGRLIGGQSSSAREGAMRLAAKLTVGSAGGPPLLAGPDMGEERVFYYGLCAYALGSADPPAMREFASACLTLRKHSLAEDALERVIADYSPAAGRDAIAADLYHLRGIARFYLEDFASALADYTLAEKYGLTSVTLYGNWAFALEGLEKWADALAMWRKVASMDMPPESKPMVEEHIKICEEKARQS